jgi:hypothetical protein
VTLDAEDIEAIARRVTQLLSTHPSGVVYIDARELAERLGVERSWVYAHARELGGVRLGDGPRARLRFDVERVRGMLGDVASGPAVEVNGVAPRSPARRQRSRGTKAIELITGRGSR